MVDAIKVAPLLFVLAVLQVSSAPQLSPTGSAPDLLLILVVAVAALRGLEAGAITGFAGGLLLDAMLFERLGVTSLLYLFAAWFASRLAGGSPRVGRLLLLVLGAALLVQVGYAALAALLGEGYPLGFVWRHAVLPVAAETTLVSLVALPLLRRLFSPRVDAAAVPA